MTKVYVTRTGSKYHAREDCPTLADAERQNGHAIARWPVDLHGLDKEPCSRCWREAGAFGSWEQLVHRVERIGDSVFEALFVKNVLRHVTGLRPQDVLIQRPAQGRSGAAYRIDFVIDAPSGERLAVEVDGTDKAPGRVSVQEIQRQVDGKRADLVAAGWRVLNFSNDRVATRSEQCVTELEAALGSLVTPRPAAPTVSPSASKPEQVRPAPPASPAATPGTVDNQPRRDRSRSALVLGIAAALLVVGGSAWFLTDREQSEAANTPQGSSCPGSAPVKGNINEAGEKIYHEPGWRYYSATWPEACFESADDAERDGYRASEIQ